jgi:hypothetical protein
MSGSMLTPLKPSGEHSVWEENMAQGERPSREEKRSKIEAMALGSALQDALRDLVKVHGITYLDTFLEGQLQSTVEELRRDSSVKAPGILAAQRSTADDAEAALRREIGLVASSPNKTRKADAFATS